jgi:hypothetical protein
VCFGFLYKFVRNIFHSKRNWARYDKECILVFMLSTLLSCPILIKLEFSREIFENFHISNFTKICPVEAELFHADGRADRRTDRNEKLLVFLRNFAKAPKNEIFIVFLPCYHSDKICKSVNCSGTIVHSVLTRVSLTGLGSKAIDD